MIPRRFLITLVYLLPVLVVTFAVLAAGYLLLATAPDRVAAEVLRWIASSVLILIVVDVVLLVGALGLEHLHRDSGDHRSDDENA